MRDVVVEKRATIPTSMNHYGTAKLILEKMEVLRKKDGNVSFTVNYLQGVPDAPSSVTFVWRERESLDA